jgi:cytochrome c-type biogenesis protein CcmF
VTIGNAEATFVGFDMSQQPPAGGVGTMAVGAKVALSGRNGREVLTPVTLFAANEAPVFKGVPSRILNGTVQLIAVKVGMGGDDRSAVTMQVERGGAVSQSREILVVEASIKPFINLLWGGALVLMAGFLLSILKRSKES